MLGAMNRACPVPLAMGNVSRSSEVDSAALVSVRALTKVNSLLHAMFLPRVTMRARFLLLFLLAMCFFSPGSRASFPDLGTPVWILLGGNQPNAPANCW